MTGFGTDGPVPAGKLKITITHLEMRQRPLRVPAPPPLAKFALLKVEEPTVRYYRYLYDSVGENWLWADRRVMPDDELLALLRDERTAIYVLYLAGTPAGYAELFHRSAEVVELCYFGLIPEFIGRRLGPFFLDEILDTAWMAGPERVIVQTCTLDHPKALQLYQRAGFTPVGQETILKDDPRLSGIIPRTAAPHVPLAQG